MNWDVIETLITAASGLAGVWLGGNLTSKHETMKEGRRVQAETTYLATLVGAHLERFINECVSVAFDNGTIEGQPAGDGHTFFSTTTVLPAFDPLSLNVDWKVLPSDLMFEVLSVPSRVQTLSQRLSDPGLDDPPDHAYFFWERQSSFAKLGLDVSAVARSLRSHAGLKAHAEAPDGAVRDGMLRRQAQKIHEEKSKHEDRVRLSALQTSGL
jgi:hypothetical protein